MNFTTGYILTKAGEALHAKVEAGATLKLTKMQLGSGTVTTVDDYYERSALVEPQNAMSIAEIQQVTAEKNMCVATAVLTNAAVDTSYMASELGLFAQNTDGTEILYAVSYDDHPSYIASKNDGTDITMKFSMYIVATSEITITLTLPKTAEEIATVAAGYAAQAAESELKANQLEATANNYLQTTQQAMALANSYADLSKAWAESATSPDSATDTDSPTGYTQSAKIWAALSKEYAGLSKFKLPIGYYNSVDEMRKSETAIVGRPCVTLGYYEPNDGGGAVYIIRSKTDSDTDDGGSIIVLDNGNVAEMLVEDAVNVKQFGAKGDGATDDLTALTNCINSIYSTIRVPSGQYYMSDSLYITQSHRTILLDADAYIFTKSATKTGATIQILGKDIRNGNAPASSSDVTEWLEDIHIIGGHIYNDDTAAVDNGLGLATVKDCSVENVTIDKAGRKGITCQYGADNLKILNCTIRNSWNGISVEHWGTNVLISGNTIVNIGGGPSTNVVSYLCDGIYAAYPVTIVDNYIDTVNNAGLYLLNQTNTGASNNMITNAREGVIATSGDLYIHNNVFIDITDRGVIADCDSVKINGNTFKNVKSAVSHIGTLNIVGEYTISNNIIDAINYAFNLDNVSNVIVDNNHLTTDGKVAAYLTNVSGIIAFKNNNIKTLSTEGGSIGIWADTTAAKAKTYVGNLITITNGYAMYPGIGNTISVGNVYVSKYTWPSNLKPLVYNDIFNGASYTNISLQTSTTTSTT